MNWQNKQWTKADYQELIDFLISQSDQQYKKFNEKIIADQEASSYGVRMPVLRQLSKEICRGNWADFLSVPKSTHHEEVLLQGMVIATAKMDYPTRLTWIDSYVPQITNWALCDCFVTKGMLAKNKVEFWPEVDRFLKSPNPWSQRFAYIVMMTYYLDDAWIEAVFERVKIIDSDQYYVQMAQAWLLATALVKQRTATKDFLVENKAKLNQTVIKMTIRKIRDSYRVSAADKDWALTLKS